MHLLGNFVPVFFILLEIKSYSLFGYLVIFKQRNSKMMVFVHSNNTSKNHNIFRFSWESLTKLFGFGYVSKDVCQSKLILCPYCEHYSLCPFVPLKTECSFSRLGFLLDNPANVFFSMFMSVWGKYRLKRRNY